MRSAMRYCVVDDRCIGRTMEGRPSGDLLIAADVGAGCPNRRDDVLVVQSLLNVAYARIRVPSRTIAVDGIVGSETNAALLHFQRAHFGGGDGRVEAAGRTLARLNAVAAGPPRRSGTARAASLPSPLDLALDAAALARRWAADARAHLVPLLDASTLRRRMDLATVNTHFHLDRDVSGGREAVSRMLEVFARIEQVLAAAADVFREGATLIGSPVVETPLGAFDAADPGRRAITFRPGLTSYGPNTRAALILHACTHFVGDEIEHFALEFPAPDGAPHERGSRNYRELTPAEALCNAASYTAFAIHAATGSDQRFGARDTRL
jgi:peptidoglycan hydrolase-like protein with peptidoglycan-binding domain